MSAPALVRWGSSAAWFSDARDADALACVLRRGPDTVTVKSVTWGPDECDDAMTRRNELEEAINAAINALDVGDAAVSPEAAKTALEALQETRP